VNFCLAFTHRKQPSDFDPVVSFVAWRSAHGNAVVDAKSGIPKSAHSRIRWSGKRGNAGMIEPMLKPVK
jgi:hypothetical protein